MFIPALFVLELVWTASVLQLAVATTLSTLNVKDVIDVMPGLMKSSVALLNQADLGWYFL